MRAFDVSSGSGLSIFFHLNRLPLSARPSFSWETGSGLSTGMPGYSPCPLVSIFRPDTALRRLLIYQLDIMVPIMITNFDGLPLGQASQRLWQSLRLEGVPPDQQGRDICPGLSRRAIFTSWHIQPPSGRSGAIPHSLLDLSHSGPITTTTARAVFKISASSSAIPLQD